MTSTLNYGNDASIDLKLHSNQQVTICDAPRGEPVSDVAQAIVAAISQPIDYPPLSQAMVPEDRIVIALEGETPQAPAVVAALIDYLLGHGATPPQICVVRSTGDASNVLAETPEEIAKQIRLETHDPADRSQLSYLATTEQEHPVYISRTIYDADLVIPVSCVRAEEALGYHGAFGGLYPTFSDSKTQGRYRNPGSLEARNKIQRRTRREVNEVGWLLGVQFAVRIVPGAGSKILRVFAGAAESVDLKAREAWTHAWSYQVPRPASLVVAAISGDQSQQTWQNVGRALATATRAVAENGAIALCTDLREPPGPGVQSLADAEDRTSVVRHLRKHRPPDALYAIELAEAQAKAKVYLLSQLDESMVEELGIGYIAEATEVERLARRHESCLMIANAQHATATPQVSE